jgi:Fur family iron response transcriptional regulator
LKLLFGGGNRHLTARRFHEQAAAVGTIVSLATVYNTLKLVSRHGLVREVVVGGVTYFDTNVARHNHVFFEDTRSLMDSPCDEWTLGVLPIPDGYEIVRVDLTLRLSLTKVV